MKKLVDDDRGRARSLLEAHPQLIGALIEVQVCFHCLCVLLVLCPLSVCVCPIVYLLFVRVLSYVYFLCVVSFLLFLCVLLVLCLLSICESCLISTVSVCPLLYLLSVCVSCLMSTACVLSYCYCVCACLISFLPSTCVLSCCPVPELLSCCLCLVVIILIIVSVCLRTSLFLCVSSFYCVYVSMTAYLFFIFALISKVLSLYIVEIFFLCACHCKVVNFFSSFFALRFLFVCSCFTSLS